MGGNDNVRLSARSNSTTWPAATSYEAPTRSGRRRRRWRREMLTHTTSNDNKRTITKRTRPTLQLQRWEERNNTIAIDHTNNDNKQTTTKATTTTLQRRRTTTTATPYAPVRFDSSKLAT